MSLATTTDHGRPIAPTGDGDGTVFGPTRIGNAGVMTPATSPLPSLDVDQVLVPLDGSEFALRVLPTARVLAEHLHAELHTISVTRADDSEHIRAFAAAALGVDPGDKRVHIVTDGEPAEAIARRAEELDACVVCMSTHGRGRLSGAFVGSVARSLLQRSRDPLVALGPMADNPGWTPRPRSWPEPLSIPRIVACVDGSDSSEQILPVATRWAAALGWSMTIFTVIGDAPPIRPEHKSRYGPHGEANSYIDALVERWRGRLPDLDGVVMHDPISPASGIRLHLDQRPAGLVAVTTHARSGLKRAFLGATAASVVHASVAPCLVAPVQIATGDEPPT